MQERPHTQGNTNTDRHPCLERHSNPVFERQKTVHTVDCAATVIGALSVTCNLIIKDTCDTQRNLDYDNKLDQGHFLISLFPFQITESFETGTIRMHSC
jgi:hypothetical protein